MSGIPDYPFIPISERTAELSRVHYGVMSPLLALVIVAFGFRVYVRVFPVWRVGWDDWLIALGFLSSVVDFILLSWEMFTEPTFLTFDRATLGIKLAYMAIPVWVVSMTCIKISVALTLIERFHPVSYTTRWWRPMLISLIVVQLLYLVANIIWTFSKCRPLVAAWDVSLGESAACYTTKADFYFSTVGSAINISTDVALSLSPMLAVFWRMRRPLPERLLMCCLTGIGLLASSASLAKAVVVAQWNPDLPADEFDSWAMAVSIATWTVAEQFIAVFGACSPSLKGPIERLLGRYGIRLSSTRQTSDLPRIESTIAGDMSMHQEGGGGKNAPVMFEAAAPADSSTSTDGEIRMEKDRTDMESR